MAAQDPRQSKPSAEPVDLMAALEESLRTPPRQSVPLCPGTGRAPAGALNVIFGVARCPGCDAITPTDDDTGAIVEHRIPLSYPQDPEQEKVQGCHE